MKAIILAGGLGSRLSEETVLRPKPMVEIGGRPILWHIMNIHAAHGITEFIVALGYKAEVVKEYFLNFYALQQRHLGRSGQRPDNHSRRQSAELEDPSVDTGLHTQTGGRLKRLAGWLDPDETFMFTYGDGVTDLDLTALIGFHAAHGRLATVTTVRPPARFGRMPFKGRQITEFYEKPRAAKGGSMAATSSSMRRRSTTSTVTAPSGNATRSSGCRRTVS